MRVIITSTGKDMDSQVDPRFGRCPYYIVVDVEAKKIEKFKAMENEAVGQGHGAGFAAAQQVGDMEADCIITGNIGPNAARTLNQLEIAVYHASGKVSDAIKQLLDGKLEQIKQVVPGHFGSGQGMGKGRMSMAREAVDEEETQKGGKEAFVKKLAVATENGKVAVHFGRCQQFTIVEIENGKVKNKEVVDNPGHMAGYLPKFLYDKGVNYMVAGAMGPMAVDYFRQYGIEVVLGVKGSVEKVIKDFVEDRLESGEPLAEPGEGKGHGVERE